MISVASARQIIQQHVQPLPPAQMTVMAAAGHVLAEDVYASATVPAFRQSSMDGYAFCFDDWLANNKLTVTGVVAAGHTRQEQLITGGAVRIFTGAPVPPGADTVVMQEKTKRYHDELVIEDDKLQRGSNLRPEGAEIKKGELALARNALLTPAAIGFLTTVGITHVTVYPPANISIIVTGDELREAGSTLLYGQVYESNAAILQAALQQFHLPQAVVYRVKDDLEVLSSVLGKAIAASDMVLLTGGISVGDFDFVLQAALNNGAETLFHTIRQRPAKPLYFGKKEGVCIFGLPGNPASGLVSFYEYVLPALGGFSKRHYALQALKVPLEEVFTKPAGLTHFLKGWYNGHSVAVLPAQESYRLSSFAKANCLIQVEEDTTRCNAGDLVEIHILPF